MVNPQHLLTFTVVARLRSISRAADALYLSQPAVSGQLRQLQNLVGEPLYTRRGYGIELTAAGQGLQRYAETLRRAHAQADDYIRQLQGVEAGSIHIGSTSTLASYYLPECVVRFQQDYPGVSVYIDTDSSLALMHRLEEFDIGMVEGPLPDVPMSGQYELLPWVADEVVLVLRAEHPLAQRYPEVVPMSALADYPIIWREPTSGARQTFERALAEAGMHLPVKIVVTGVDAIKEAVRAGLGIGFASFRALAHAGPELVYRHLEHARGICWNLYIAAPVGRLRSRATQSFLDALARVED
ncbi:hypothetical protein BI364_00830 [Acidihalobacter yilgarnensis]|uniref:HTH lysR-type domain-containing protein n=1 Tax=Acidihalobacter yilgarnensis TaxID=2819280 RepID=A0A1D8IJW4_9GAMM|nr:LysR family transcriptional regulator [Acidihalobacter yilgarnensis]AOU96746.1 hypothetical protein BI364_00830 [Acidihalobacter yilgarnensis]